MPCIGTIDATTGDVQLTEAFKQQSGTQYDPSAWTYATKHPNTCPIPVLVRGAILIPPPVMDAVHRVEDRIEVRFSDESDVYMLMGLLALNEVSPERQEQLLAIAQAALDDTVVEIRGGGRSETKGGPQ